MSRAMNLLLGLALLNLLCCHTEGWALKRPTQEQWRGLDQPQNRELVRGLKTRDGKGGFMGANQNSFHWQGLVLEYVMEKERL